MFCFWMGTRIHSGILPVYNEETCIFKKLAKEAANSQDIFPKPEAIDKLVISLESAITKENSRIIKQIKHEKEKRREETIKKVIAHRLKKQQKEIERTQRAKLQIEQAKIAGRKRRIQLKQQAKDNLVSRSGFIERLRAYFTSPTTK